MKLISICNRVARMHAFLLTAACGVTLGGCSTTTEEIPASYRDFRSGAQSFDLTERERLLCEKKASEGDILAAKRLVNYYMTLPRHEKEYHHWLKVVTRLQKRHSQKTENVSPH
jgi:hypothetical protein